MEFLNNHLNIILASIGGFVLFPIFLKLKKYVLAWFSKWFKIQLEKSLNPNLADEKEKELLKNLILALVKYVEYKCPDEIGKEKFNIVFTFLTKYIPEKYANEIIDLIEQAVKIMNEEMKNAK
ncbi:MAG: hypothetical protein QW474_03500 [Candidatus Aenigmatarchaeota archaeon]